MPIKFLLDYTKLPPETRANKALNDLHEFVGPERYSTLICLAWRDGEDAVREALSVLCGVEGYPVDVFVDRYCNVGDVR